MKGIFDIEVMVFAPHLRFPKKRFIGIFEKGFTGRFLGEFSLPKPIYSLWETEVFLELLTIFGRPEAILCFQETFNLLKMSPKNYTLGFWAFCILIDFCPWYINCSPLFSLIFFYGKSTLTMFMVIFQIVFDDY